MDRKQWVEEHSKPANGRFIQMSEQQLRQFSYDAMAWADQTSGLRD